MEKRNTMKIVRDRSSGRFVTPGVVVMTRDGVSILKSPGRATHFTDKEITEAIQEVRSRKYAGAVVSRGKHIPRKG